MTSKPTRMRRGTEQGCQPAEQIVVELVAQLRETRPALAKIVEVGAQVRTTHEIELLSRLITPEEAEMTLGMLNKISSKYKRRLASRKRRKK